MTAVRGLTWDHPRGRAPLVAAAARCAGELDITWDVQPLEGFESLGRLLLGHAAHDRGGLGAPALPGYIEFQSRGSQLIRDGLAERVPAARLLDRLDALWRASLPTGAVL